MTANRKATWENKRGFVRKFFAPSVLLMNRLKYLKKFILISACFAVPIAISMYLLIDKNIDYWEGFTRKEAEGVQYISHMSQLLGDIQIHRGLAMISIAGGTSFIAGDATVGDMLLLKESEIDEELKELGSLLEKLPEPTKGKWNDIKGKWRSLKEKEAGNGLSADERFKEHGSLIEDIETLMEMAAYDTDLILDPAPDSFYLINLMVRDLPRMIEHIERLNALGSYGLAGKRLGTHEKEELIAESGAVRDGIETLKGEIVILDAQPALKRDAAFAKIKAAIDLIIASSENYLTLVDTSIIHSEKLDMPPWEFFNTSTEGFFQPMHKTYDISEAELINIFSARTRSLVLQSLAAWSATIIILTVVLYLLAGFYLSVIDTVSRLGTATRQMSLTGLPETITLESRDELNEVVMLFNEVAIALRRSHEVLLNSERLARLGSWDLDTVAKTMQWSPGMYRIYRLDPAQLTGAGLETLYLKVHPDDARMVRENIEKGIGAGDIPLFEYRIMLEDGSVRHLSCEGKARPYGIGRPVRMTGFVQDITDRKKSEEEILEALKKVKQLSGLLPICASCKKIRNDKGYWESIEKYIEKHSEAEFSHSICDDCVKKLYPDFHKRESDTR